MEVVNPVENRDNHAKTFTFRELATATKNFRQECLIGEGGSGRVYKGILTSTGQVVAVKQLDRHGFQGGKDFHSEVSALSLLRHENLVNLIGFCADGDQRVLVYEFMSGGTLQDHLLDRAPEKKPLDWFTRMKIAFGAAKGLEYLHDQANPPVIFRDLKPSNILLTEDLTAKLSDYGLARLSPSGDNSPISSRMMGTYGYAAPEYNRSGNLTMKSDVYSFGVVFLEILTGRRAMDTTRPIDEQNIVTWATPMFRDPKRFPDLADPLLEMRFPEKDLNQAVAIAAMCLQEEPGARPLISDVVVALSFLSVTKEIIMPNPPPPAVLPVEERVADNDHHKNEAELSSSDDGEDSGSSEDDDASDKKNSEGEESVDSESEVNETGYQYSNSYSKRQVSSLRKSTKKHVSSSKHISSSRSQDKGGSAALKTSQVSRYGSISSIETRTRSSHDGDPLLSQKSSKVSRHALSHKSSRGCDDRSHSSSSRRSRGSSINSRDGIGSMSRKSSGKSRTKSKRHHHDSSSDHGSEDGGLSSIRGSSRGSDNESLNHWNHSNCEVFEEENLLFL